MPLAPSSDLIDILIPVRNGGEPLRRTLQALRASGDQGFRVIISDNHSTDGSPWRSELEAFLDGQVSLIQPPEPLGRVEHWSWIAGQAKATYCKLLLCGDRFPADYLEKIRPALTLAPDLVYMPYIILGRGNTIEEELSSITQREELTRVTSENYARLNRRLLNPIGPLSAPLFRTTSLQAALPFDTANPWTADWRMYSRIMEKGTAVMCLSTYCIQDRSIARLSSSFQGALKGIFEERAYNREINGLPPALGIWRYLLAWKPLVGLVMRHYLPRFLSKPLSDLAGLLSGRRRARA